MDRKIVIEHRKLRPDEISSIIVDIKNFPDLAYVKPSLLQRFENVFVAMVDGQFAGFCVIDSFRNVNKLGPLAVKADFQKNGVGAFLLKRVMTIMKGEKVCFGTSNKALQKHAESIGATCLGGVWSVPLSIKIAFLYFLIEYISIKYVYEALRKKLTFGRGKYLFYEI